MPSRVNSYFPERKITQPNPAPNAKPGSTPAMVMRTANWPGLPGKASNAFASMKAGVKEVNGYAMYDGLSKKKWIQGAIKHPGALTKQAKKAGQSPMAYAADHMHDSGKTGQRARLAMTLKKMHH